MSVSIIFLSQRLQVVKWEGWNSARSSVKYTLSFQACPWTFLFFILRNVSVLSGPILSQCGGDDSYTDSS